jgi:predicted nuclease of predicted toxin-antitoxin system
LLFDENLSTKLASKLADLFPTSSHVVLEGLRQASDLEIWRHARSRDFALVTADADFFALATALGPPPKVVWLRGCDYPTAVAERLIRRDAIRIAEFLRDASGALMIVKP